ncbi:SDR family NAD(P)-dependent oxidoreductase [Streptomyces sp. NPDC057565]|uniref:SDR family NAD(P)-dependent oxidoreductase n=1 Tax=Streptomyces sp. NPDC057565 TaxID=3346169 RepID=UPI0036B58988
MQADPWGLSGKTVLLTGALGGIGIVCAAAFADAGARVLLSDLPSPADAAEQLTAHRFGAENYLSCDVRSPAQVESILDDATDMLGAAPDIVSVHAGLVGSFPIEQYPIDEFDNLMAVNLRGSFLTACAAAQRWRTAGRGGNLIFTTSWVQDVPWPEIGPYAASKAAVRALMRGFARELAPHGIRANALAPGIVGVGMARRQWDSDPTYQARARRAIPLGTLQDPKSVADAMLFLASPRSAYMTGSTLVIDGGASLYPMD